MKLVFRGHDDRYAVEQSLLAFFPEERPVYETAEAGEDDCAYVSLTEGKRYATGHASGCLERASHKTTAASS